MTYTPKPIDTSKTAIPKNLGPLIELLAHNAHEVYAEARLSEGWSYGPRRDDRKKRNPTLVPYDHLPESEKEYDRRMVLQTLRSIITLGYRVEGPAVGGGRVPAERTAQAFDMYVQRGEALRRTGYPLQAYDVLSEGLDLWQGNPELRRMRALALADCGAPDRANAELVCLERGGQVDTETLGALARTHKDLWELRPRSAEGKRHLRRAYGVYRKAYLLSEGKSYWAGINAATMALLRGCRQEARTLATRVRTTCRRELRELRRKDDDPYWVLATIGEACLILEEDELAKHYYHEAFQSLQGRYAYLSSTRRNARILLRYLNKKCDEIDALMPMPSVAVFVGHMVDQPGRSVPRFPAALVQPLRRALAEKLTALHVGFGYVSASCGADLLFSEALLRLGGETNIVLPCSRDLFRRESVDIIPRARWGKRYETVLNKAVSVREVSLERTSSWGDSYDYANRVLFGLARLHAHQLDTRVIPMAAWDRKPGDGIGRTATTVQWWQQKLGLKVEIIDMGTLLRTIQPEIHSEFGGINTRRACKTAKKKGRKTASVMSILFADVVGYSKLREDHIPLFVRHFLGGVAKVLRRRAHPPQAQNTWGDALYLVFNAPEDAGLSALELCEFVEGTLWQGKGLPADMSIRVSLHAGPLFALRDPVLGASTYTGSHASRAARIEPITPPGQVYCSEPFAALAAAEGISSFRCDYVGKMLLAKGFGNYPTYHVRRAVTSAG